MSNYKLEGGCVQVTLSSLMTPPRKSHVTVPRSPASGIGNSRFTNYLQNKSPARASPASRLSEKYATAKTPVDLRQLPEEESLGNEIAGLGNDIRDLHEFISSRNTPEGKRKVVYGTEDIGLLVKELIEGALHFVIPLMHMIFRNYSRSLVFIPL